jgi:hypothetical protein
VGVTIVFRLKRYRLVIGGSGRAVELEHCHTVMWHLARAKLSHFMHRVKALVPAEQLGHGQDCARQMTSLSGKLFLECLNCGTNFTAVRDPDQRRRRDP